MKNRKNAKKADTTPEELNSIERFILEQGEKHPDLTLGKLADDIKKSHANKAEAKEEPKAEEKPAEEAKAEEAEGMTLFEASEPSDDDSEETAEAEEASAEEEAEAPAEEPAKEAAPKKEGKAKHTIKNPNAKASYRQAVAIGYLLMEVKGLKTMEDASKLIDALRSKSKSSGKGAEA